MQQEIIWKSHPSILHFIPSYILALVGVYLLVKLQYFLAANPLDLILYYADWHRPYQTWQWSDWPIFAIAASYIAMVLLVLNAIFKIFKARWTEYLLLNDQIVVRQLTPFGIIENRTEMYRIVDYRQTQSFVDVFFNLSTIILRSTDQQMPYITIFGIPKGRQVIDLLRDETEKCRMKKGVREITSAAFMPPFDPRAGR